MTQNTLRHLIFAGVEFCTEIETFFSSGCGISVLRFGETGFNSKRLYTGGSLHWYSVRSFEMTIVSCKKLIFNFRSSVS